jgi:hypothetical protein
MAKEKKVKWGIYIPESLMNMVKKDAEKEDRSINYVVERILKKFYNA